MNKEWTLYPFLPALCSILVSLYITPIYSRNYDEKLRAFLKMETLESIFPIVSGISKDRALQISYLTGIPAFVASLVATIRSSHPVALTTAVALTFLIILRVYVRMFSSPPGHLTTTRFPRRGKPKFIYERGWTYSGFYSFLLILFNLVLIGVIAFALPRR